MPKETGEMLSKLSGNLLIGAGGVCVSGRGVGMGAGNRAACLGLSSSSTHPHLVQAGSCEGFGVTVGLSVDGGLLV